MVSALAAVWFAGSASPAAAGAERAVEALFACDADFFEVLKSERAAFRSNEVRTIFYEHQRIDIVKFDPPVEALGLRLTSYRQETGLNYGLRPTTFSWGFQADEAPRVVALALSEYFPGEQPFSGNSEMLVPTEAHTDQSGKSFMITKPRLEGETGANLQCHAERKMLGNIWSLPDVVDLLFETWDSKGRWLVWVSDWLE
jgi:hypothetical protein